VHLNVPASTLYMMPIQYVDGHTVLHAMRFECHMRDLPVTLYGQC